MTGGAVGEKPLLAEKWNVGVELLVVFPASGVTVVTSGIAWTCCSVITLTLLLVWLATYTVLVMGLNPIGFGSVPTARVKAVPVAPSMTLTLPAVLLLT